VIRLHELKIKIVDICGVNTLGPDPYNPTRSKSRGMRDILLVSMMTIRCHNKVHSCFSKIQMSKN